MVGPIVIGAQPKRDDLAPLELGVMLSRLTGAPIHVIGTYWFDSTPRRTANEEYAEALRQDVGRAVEQVLGGEELEAPVEVHVKPGSPAHALQETAAQLEASLIVLGSTRRGRLGRTATGTTADRVLDGAPCPVVIAPSGFRRVWGPAPTVGVAFVDTQGGRSALAAGAAMARGTGAKLIAFTVTEADTDAGDRARAEAAVDRALAEYADDLECEARVLTGGAAALAAESRNLDFLVRGCRGGGRLRAPLAREVPSRLANAVECPFVVVAPGREQPLVSLFAGDGAGRETQLLA